MTKITLLFMILGLFVPTFYNHATGYTSPPRPPLRSQLPMPPPSQPELSATQRSASTNQICTLTPSLIEIEGTPQQIEGPYFVDDMPNRSDIRLDTSNGSLQEGVPLRLSFYVYDVNESIEYFDKVLAIDPNDVDALNNKGFALYNLRQIEAIKYYDKALSIDPNNVVVLDNKQLAIDNLG